MNRDTDTINVNGNRKIALPVPWLVVVLGSLFGAGGWATGVYIQGRDAVTAVETLGARFKEMGERVARNSDKVGARLDDLVATVRGIDKSLAVTSSNTDGRMSTLEARVTRLESDVGAIREELKEMKK